MAEFEGDLNLNVETSEIEVKGKFKITEEELDKVAGGYIEVDDFCTCDEWREGCSGFEKYCHTCFWFLDKIVSTCSRPGGPVNFQQGSYPF